VEEGAMQAGNGTSGRMGLAVCALAGAAAGFVIGGSDPVIGVLAAGGVISAWLVLKREALGLWLLLAGTCFLGFHAPLPGTEIETFSLPDLLLVLLFGVAALHRLASGRRWIVVPLQAPVLTLCAVGAARVALGSALGDGIPLEMIQEYRVLLYYAVALLMPNILRTRRALRRFVMACFVLAVLAAANLVVRTVLNPPSAGMTEGEIYYALAELAGGSGNILVYWALCCCISLLIVERMRATYAALLVAYLVYFGLMFHRHMYLGAAFAAAAVALLSGRLHRNSVLRLGAVVVCVGLVVGLVALSGGPAVERYITLTVHRVESLKGIAGTDTVSDRMIENKHALEQMRANPAVGLGFAKRYRPSLYGAEDTGRFIHNAYFWFVLRMGVLGLAAFVWMAARFLRRTLRDWSGIEDRFLRAVALGSVVAFMGLALMNLGAPYFVQNWGTAAVAMAFGAAEAAFRTDAAERKSPGSGAPA
jgi:hypothetical protein